MKSILDYLNVLKTKSKLPQVHLLDPEARSLFVHYLTRRYSIQNSYMFLQS